MNALEIPPLVVHSRPALRLPALTTSDEVTRLYVDGTTQDIVAFTSDGCVAFFTSCNAAVTLTTHHVSKGGVAQPLLYFRPTQEHEDNSRMSNSIVESTYPRIARRHPTPLLYTQDSTDRSTPPVYYLVALSNESNSVDFYHVPACNSTAYSTSSSAAFTDAESEESTVHVGCLVVHCVGRYRCTPPGLRFCTSEYYPIHTFHWCLPDTTFNFTPSALENDNGCYDSATHVLMCVSAVSIDVFSVHLKEDERNTTHSVNNTSLLSLPHTQLTMLQQYITHTDGWCYEPHTATLLSLNVRKSHVLKPFRITPLHAHSGTKEKVKDVIQPLRKLVLDKSEGEVLCRARGSQSGSQEIHCTSMVVSSIADTLGFILLYNELYLYHIMSTGTHILLYHCESNSPLSKDKISSSSIGFIPAVLLVWGTGIEPCQPRCLQVVDHILLVHHLADRVTTVYDTAMASEDNMNSAQGESSEVSHNTLSVTQHVTHRTVSSLFSSFASTTPLTVSASRGWLTALLPDTTSAPSMQEESINCMSSYAVTKSSTVAALCTHTSPVLTPLLIAPLCLYSSENTNTIIEGHTVTADFAVYDDCLFTKSTGDVGTALVIHPVHRAVYHVGINPFVLVAGSILARHTGAPLARFFLRRFCCTGNTLPRLLRVLLHEACMNSESVVRTTAWCQFVQVMDVCLTAYGPSNTPSTAAICTLSDTRGVNAGLSAQLRLSVSADVLHDKLLWQVMCATPQGCLSVVDLCHYVFRYMYDELCAFSTVTTMEGMCTGDIQQAWRVLWRAVKYFARQVTLQVNPNALQPFTDVLEEMMMDVVFAAAANSECTAVSLVANVRWLVTELRELLHSLPWYRPQMSLVHRLLSFIDAHNITYKGIATVMSLATQLLLYLLQQSSSPNSAQNNIAGEEDDDDVLDLWLRYASCEDVHELMRELREREATQVMQRLLQRAHIASENDSDAMRVYKCLLSYCDEA